MAHEMLQKIKQFAGYSSAVMSYAAGSGMPVLRETLARFLHMTVFKLEAHLPAISPNQLVVSCGVTALLHELSIVLFDVGDAVLVPTPFYPAFDHDFWDLGEVWIEGTEPFSYCCSLL